MYEKEFDKIFQIAKDKVDDIEIVLTESKSFSVKIEKQAIDSFNYADSKGIGVRVIKDNRTGYAYTEKFDDDSFETIVKDAVENSKTIEDIQESEMSNFEDKNTDLECYNKELKNIDIQKKIDLAKLLEKKTYNMDKRVFNVPYSGYSDGESYYKIANSKGLNKEFKQNYIIAYVSALVQENDEKRMGMEFIITRDFDEIDPEFLVKNSVDKAIALLGGKQISSGEYTVVFNNEAMATMLSTFWPMFSGKSVIEGKSLLKDKIGTKIASDTVTIVDDALMHSQFASRPFDSEGYPSQTNLVVENGVLKTFLHNTETAKKLKTQSTGNAHRSYKGSLTVATSNFYLRPGTVNRERLFKSKSQIVEIVSLQGMHSGANSISGEFSLSAEGFLYVNGERSFSLTPFTISGNFYELLKNIVLIANDFRFDMSSFGSASVLVDKLNITSK